MRQHLARVLYQHDQQSVFDRGEVNFAPLTVTLRCIMSTFSSPTEKIPSSSPFRGGRHMTQCHAYPCQQFAHAEWFDQIIICTRIQGGNLIAFLRACRQNDDRNGRPSAYTLDHFNSVHIGQAKIENNQVRLARRCFGQSPACRFRPRSPDSLPRPVKSAGNGVSALRLR